jgi:ferredoxin/flavodoxin---NADP+ reductase
MSHPQPPDSQDGAVDLAIIGAGPTGLFAAFYAGLREMSVKIIDSLDILGGQLNTLYPEKYIYDVAGFPKILSKDLVGNLVEQAMQYHPAVCLGEQVATLEELEGGKLWRLGTNRATHLARSILIAAGVGAFKPKTLPLPNAAEYHGRGLHYFVKDLSVFADKRVLIVGGGDSAVDWANTLATIASELTLIHRRDQFRAHEDSVRKMFQTPARINTFHELRSIHGQGRIEQAVIFDNRSQAELRLEIDALLVNIGFSNSLGPIKDWGLNIEKGQILVDSLMRTNRPGIFAAGDIAAYPGKLKLIATGFGEACTAVCNAKHHIDPAARVFPGHSSEMKR